MKRLLTFLLAASALSAGFAYALPDPPAPTFRNVTVHDPSVIRVNGVFYIFGSHMAAARSSDLMAWTSISSPFANPAQELAAALAWSATPTSPSAHWAPAVIRLADGRFYFYYCTGNLAAPTGYLGLAVSNNVEGPYTNLGLIRRSGESGFNANIHPNSVDPHTFFDSDGNLWMVYGSYSGGIFILRMDPNSGFPTRSQDWGTRLIGGNHSRIEAPFILYSPETEYYYLFLSFGGLASDGGYNMRMARSRHPAGPYFDSAGTDMRNARGPPGSFFDDAAIAPHGAKLAGNFRFLHFPGEPLTTSAGYRSPGHNSAYFDSATGKYLNIFHTRFVGTGQHAEAHQVRVHQMFMNEDGWLVMAPHRYAGETIRDYSLEEIVGHYKFINHGAHGKAITAEVVESVIVTLRSNGLITGAVSGGWQLRERSRVDLTINGVLHRGVFIRQWDHDNRVWVTAFTALSAATGAPVWGSKVAIPPQPMALQPVADRMIRYGESLRLSLNATGGDLFYTLVSAPQGMSVNSATGEIEWRPLLTQTAASFPVVARAEVHGAFAETTFNVTVAPVGNLNRIDLDFTSAVSDGSIRDATGQSTGFTRRLAGTGGQIPGNDPNLRLNNADGHLLLGSTRSDFNGQAGMGINSSPGIALSDLGFTGGEDFAVKATFKPLPPLEFIDQVGVFVGASGAALTRAGIIVFSAPERYAVHTQNGADHDARFQGTGFNGNDGMTVIITREAGIWRYFVDGIEWNPMSNSQKIEPAYLNFRADLIAGVFAINPFNNNPKQVRLDSFSVMVVNGDRPLTQIEAWRAKHFGSTEPVGNAADLADADGDGLPNLIEYALGGNPNLAGDGVGRISVSDVGGFLRLTFSHVGDLALTYQIEAASSLGGPWTAVHTYPAFTATGTQTHIDTAPASASNRRFLRLRVSIAE